MLKLINYMHIYRCTFIYAYVLNGVADVFFLYVTSIQISTMDLALY